MTTEGLTSEDEEADVCRGIGISETTFYVWKKKCASLGVSELCKAEDA